MSRVIAVLLATLVLVACGAAASGDGDSPATEFTHVTRDGQTVTCLQVYYRGLGLSCNWEDAS